MEKMQFGSEGKREWTGLGNHQEVTPARQTHALTQFNQDEEFAKKAHVHLWVVMLTHRASDTMLDSFVSNDPGDLPLLDADTLAMPPATICWICTQPFDSRMRLRRCPGE